MHRISSVDYLLKAFAVIYAAAAVLFVGFGDTMLRTLNALGGLVAPASPAISIPSERFWIVLVASLMLTLTYLSWVCGRDARANRTGLVAILISKLASTLCFIFFYATSEYTFAYLAGAVTDGLIFLAHLAFYAKVFRTTD